MEVEREIIHVEYKLISGLRKRRRIRYANYCLLFAISNSGFRFFSSILIIIFFCKLSVCNVAVALLLISLLLLRPPPPPPQVAMHAEEESNQQHREVGKPFAVSLDIYLWTNAPRGIDN